MPPKGWGGEDREEVLAGQCSWQREGDRRPAGRGASPGRKLNLEVRTLLLRTGALKKKSKGEQDSNSPAATGTNQCWT